MTNPVTPLYKQGDIVLLNGQVTTIKSWPATNEGHFSWERYVAPASPVQSASSVQGTSWYGATEAGKPHREAAVIEPYAGPAVPNTLTPPVIDTADLVVDGLIDETPAVEETVEDVPADADADSEAAA